MAFDNATTIITDSISSILEGDLNKIGFFRPFIYINQNENFRFRRELFKDLESKLSKFSFLRIKPDWLNYDDYEEICNNGIKAISKDLILSYPELFTFLSKINFKPLSINEIIDRINNSNISNIGRVEILSKIIKQYRFDLNNSNIDIFKNINFFPSNDTFVNAYKLKNYHLIPVEYIKDLQRNTEDTDINYFLKKLGLDEIKISEVNLSNVSFQETVKTEIQIFKTEPTIKKWRSSEQNAAEFLKSLKEVLSVQDVSQANLGYDLEVLFLNGKRIYIEIKSVSSFIEPFKISNNEYSCAHNFGKNYYIGLVVNTDLFEMKFIQNPVEKIQFEKKCERWSWFCDKYENYLNDINFILNK